MGELERLLASGADPTAIIGLIANAGSSKFLERVLRNMPPGNRGPSAIEDAIRYQRNIDEKVLLGQVSGGKLIGAHSPRILSDSAFQIISQNTVSDGCVKVRFQKVLSPGPPPVLAQPKTSTLPPVTWTDDDVLAATDTIASGNPVVTRVRDRATLHEGEFRGIRWYVIKDQNGRVTSSFPSGGTDYRGQFGG